MPINVEFCFRFSTTFLETCEL